MRSPVGPFLVVLGLGSTLLIVLLLFQVIGLRNDLDRAEERVATLQAEVEAQDPGVTAAELRRELDELRTFTRDWLIATDRSARGDEGDVGTPAGGDPEDPDYAALVRRIDLVLQRIEALDQRVDEICEDVPVC
jgi:hypothetical protein